MSKLKDFVKNVFWHISPTYRRTELLLKEVKNLSDLQHSAIKKTSSVILKQEEELNGLKLSLSDHMSSVESLWGKVCEHEYGLDGLKSHLTVQVSNIEMFVDRFGKLEKKFNTKKVETVKDKIIWGTGDMAKHAFEHFTRDSLSHVICFVDTKDSGYVFCGKPVISYAEFAKMHSKYDVIVCTFDVNEYLRYLGDADVANFTIWQEHFALSAEKKENIVFDILRKFDVVNSKRKIIYGKYNRDIAFRYYGRDAIYAFVNDVATTDTRYMDKPIIVTADLVLLQDEYDIVICSKDHEEVSELLREMGIYKFNNSILLSYYTERNRDVRFRQSKHNISDPDTFLALKGSLRCPEILNEIRQVDFIENPQLLDSYQKHLKMLSRRVLTKKASKHRGTTSRNIDENLLYGKLQAFADYAGIESFNIWDFPAITHGYAIHNAHADKGKNIRLDWTSILGAGLKMKDVYHENCRDCMYFAVGPFFHYVKPFYSDAEFMTKKIAQGRNLTVFPSHSSLKVKKTVSDVNDFVTKVFEEAKQFDSVTVCVYFADYDSELVQQLEQRGAKVVTAGFSYDSSFMPRLKSIIMLSDAILTNSLGSHINHALSLNRPVKFITQKTKDLSIHKTYSKELIADSYLVYLQSLLETPDYRISEELLEAFDPTTGFNLVKSKEEIAAIFDLSKRIIETADFKMDKFISSMRHTFFDLSRATSEKEKLQYRLMKEALPDNYD